MIEARSRAMLAIAVKSITGRSCTVRKLDAWAKQGCPMTPNAAGAYAVSPVVKWLYQRMVTGSEKTWTERFAKESTLILADQRMTESGELLTVDEFGKLIGPLAIELHAQLDQIVHEVSSQSSDRAAARGIALEHCNTAIGSVRQFMAETTELFSEALQDDDDPVAKEQPPGEEIQEQSSEPGGVTTNKGDRPDFLQ
jgi:hypothetical protein